MVCGRGPDPSEQGGGAVAERREALLAVMVPSGRNDGFRPASFRLRGRGRTNALVAPRVADDQCDDVVRLGLPRRLVGTSELRGESCPARIHREIENLPSIVGLCPGDTVHSSVGIRLKSTSRQPRVLAETAVTLPAEERSRRILSTHGARPSTRPPPATTT